MTQPKTRKVLFRKLIFLISFINEYKRLLQKNIKDLSLLQYYQRKKVFGALAGTNGSELSREKILVFLPHVVSSDCFQKQNPIKLNRLQNTIDGLLKSFCNYEICLVISTVAQRNLAAHLPDYQLQYIDVQEHDNCDPMKVGLKAYDFFSQRINQFNWFLFIEDDIIINDSWFLEKVKIFNDYFQNEQLLLMPHRYEFYHGKKSYIDLLIDKNLAWNKLSPISINEIKFAEFTNCHSGMFCLSQNQLQAWIESGHIWKDKVIYNLPLETAATFNLQDYFVIYKPHVNNLSFLEVEHYDNKYTKMLSPSPQYTLSATIKK